MKKMLIQIAFIFLFNVILKQINIFLWFGSPHLLFNLNSYTRYVLHEAEIYIDPKFKRIHDIHPSQKNVYFHKLVNFRLWNYFLYI